MSEKREQRRKRLSRLLKHPAFEGGVIVIIFYSCILSACSDPRVDDTEQPRWIQSSLYVVGVVFLVELILRLVSQDPIKYFKDPWNWIDILVVSEAVVSTIIRIIKAYCPQLSSMSTNKLRVLSILRALRPLRTVSLLPKMKLMFHTVFSSLAETGSLVLVIGVLIFVSASVAVIWFSDNLTHRCFDDATGAVCDADIACLSGAYKCPAGTTCRDSGLNPWNNTLSFDSLGQSLVTCFQISTQEGWQQITFYLQDTSSPVRAGDPSFLSALTIHDTSVCLCLFDMYCSFDKFCWVFTVPLLFIVSSALLNLFPAILTNKFYTAVSAFQRSKDRKAEEKATREAMGQVVNKEDLQRLEAMAVEEDPFAQDSSDKDDFKAVLERFDFAEKEDMRLINQTLKQDEHRRDPLLQDGCKKLPFLAPSSAWWGEIRYALGTELQPFSIFIYLCVLINCLALAIYTYPEDPARNKITNATNAFFSAIFLMEMALKLVAFGPVGYCRDTYNIFDGIITILTAASMVIKKIRVVVILRTVRLAKLLSVGRAASQHKAFTAETVVDPVMDFPRIMALLSSTMGYAGYIYFVILILMFVFAIAGRYYMGAALGMPEFSSFGRAMVTMFAMTSGANWDVYMRRAMALGGDSYALFFILWMVISRYFALSFITALIIYYVDMDGRTYLAFVARGTTKSVFKMEHAIRRIYLKISFHEFKNKVDPSNKVEATGKVDLIEEKEEEVPPSCLVYFLTSPLPWGYFTEDSSFRKLCTKTLEGKVFQNILVLGIVASAITLGFVVNNDFGNQPMHPAMAATTKYVEWLVTTLFVVELILYSITQGLLLTPKSYLKGGFSNILDFTITLCSVINIALDMIGVQGAQVAITRAIKVLRIMRVFRLVRLATKSKITRMILLALATSSKAVLWVVLIISVMVVVFAVMGLTIFAGKFYHCTDPSFPQGWYRQEPAPGFPQGCPDSQWVNAPLNFDDFPKSLLTTIVIFSQDGWVAAMDSSMLSYGTEMNWDTTTYSAHNIWSAVYFIIFFGLQYLVAPLFVGVLYGTFLYGIYVDGNLRKRVPCIKEAQWSIYRMKLGFINPLVTPARPLGLRGRLYDFCVSPQYQLFTAAVTAVHCVFRFGPYFHDMEAVMSHGLTFRGIWTEPGLAFNFCATLYYMVDTFVIRLIAMGFRGLIVSLPDQIDFLMTITLVIEYSLMFSGVYQHLTFALQCTISTIITIRILKVIAAVQQPRLIFEIFLKSLPGMGSILILIVCVMYVYAIFGLIFFSNYQLQTPSPLFNKHQSFRTLGSAFMTLLGVATGDKWVDVMTAYGVMSSPGFQWVTYAYFCSFLLINKYVLCNLFLLVVLQNFMMNAEEKAGIAMGQVREFKKIWHIFDPHGKGRISLADLSRMMRCLGEPLGSSSRKPLTDATRLAQKLVYAMNLSKLWKLQDPTISEPQRIKEIVHLIPGVLPTGMLPAATTDTALATAAAATMASPEGHPQMPSTPRAPRDPSTPAGGDKKPLKVASLPSPTQPDASGPGELSPHVNPMHSTNPYCTEEEDQDKPVAPPGRARFPTVEEYAWFATPKDMNTEEARTKTVTFFDVITSTHYNAIFQVHLPDEDKYQAKRRRAQEYVNLIREGVWALVQSRGLVKKSRETQALAQMMCLQRQNISTFRARLGVVLTLAFHRWSSAVHAFGYTEVAHAECNRLLETMQCETRAAKDQARLIQMLRQENLGDGVMFKPHFDDLRRLLDSLERTFKGVQEIRKTFVEEIWELESIEIMQQFRIPRSSINSVTLSPNGDVLLLGDSDGNIKIFRKKDAADVGLGKSSTLSLSTTTTMSSSRAQYKYVYLQEVQQESAVLCMTMSTDGKRFFTAGKDNFIRMWSKDASGGGLSGPTEGKDKDKKDGAKKRKSLMGEYKLAAMMQGHKGEIYAMEAHTANVLFSVGQDGYVRMWRPPGDSTIQSAAVPNKQSMLGGRPMLFCLHVFEDPEGTSDGAFLITGGSDGILSCFFFKVDSQWILQTMWKPTFTFDAHPGRAVTATRFAWERVYSAGSDGVVKVWDPVYSVDPQGHRDGIARLEPGASVSVHAGPVSSLVYVGGTLFSSSHDMSVVPWPQPKTEMDPKEPKKPPVLVQDHLNGSISHTGAITSMYSNGQFLVTVDVAGGVVIKYPTKTTDRVKKGMSQRLEEEGLGKTKKNRSPSGRSPPRSPSGRRPKLSSVFKGSDLTSPALEGLNMEEPDFIDRPTLERVTAKAYLALLFDHTFPPKILGAKTPVEEGDDGRRLSLSEGSPSIKPTRSSLQLGFHLMRRVDTSAIHLPPLATPEAFRKFIPKASRDQKK